MLTKHARIRATQRSVPQLAIDLLLDYGIHTRAGGADRVTLDKSARKRIARDIGEPAYRALRPLLDLYLVVSDDGAVVTVAHRNHRFLH
jgi:hypothetical protein